MTVIAALLIAVMEPGLSGSADEDPFPSPQAKGAALLAAARSTLPQAPLDMVGELIVRRPRGQVLASYRFAMLLNYGACPPRARFTLYGQEGTFRSQLVLTRGDTPGAVFLDADDQPLPAPPALTDRIGRSDVTWLDLSLDYLWWTEARRTGSERVRGRDCHIVEVTPPPGAPPGVRAMRLWLDQEISTLLQAEEIGEDGAVTRRMWIRSVRRHDDRWMIRDLEIDAAGSGHRTRLHVLDSSMEP